MRHAEAFSKAPLLAGARRTAAARLLQTYVSPFRWRNISAGAAAGWPIFVSEMLDVEVRWFCAMARHIMHE